jgi:hypothetical protein
VCGEFQRKLLGTSSGSTTDSVNMLKNNAPSWLPKDGSRYYIDFSKGNLYNTVENGVNRLPGKGFEALHKGLKGVNPEDYPLVYQYQVLSDVAKGSAEQYKMRKQLLDLHRQGKLSKAEEDILVNTLDKEVRRDQKRLFRDDKPKVDGIWGTLQSSVWQRLVSASNNNPMEMLTPWRPFSKFMHQRNAIEDYRATQLGGSDTAIWTNPFSHFLKPTYNKLRLQHNKSFKGKEVQEKENINEYFDKLSLLKGLFNGNTKEAYQTIAHSSLSGLNTKDKVLRFKSALSDDQKVYFDAFSKETNQQKRKQILDMLPSDISLGYQQIWKNLDIGIKAKESGGNAHKAIAKDFLDSTNTLKKAFKGDLSLSGKQIGEIRKRVENNKDEYADLGFSFKERQELEEAAAVRTKIAQKEAAQYIQQATGTPTGLFSGWDPRLTADDIKIKTLSVGKQDLRRFGFWQGDEEKMNAMSVLNYDDQVVTQIDKIKQEIQGTRNTKAAISQALFRKGFVSTKVDINDSEMNSIIVRNNQ